MVQPPKSRPGDPPAQRGWLALCGSDQELPPQRMLPVGVTHETKPVWLIYVFVSF